jgi:streptomycin 6-kinase
MIDRQTIATYLTKWRLTLDGAPFSTHSATLAYVTRGTTHAVLKFFDPNDDESDGADILKFWEGPAARVLEADDRAVLLERAMPGTMLAELVEQGRDDDATDIWCDIAESLHRKPPSEGWTTIAERAGSFSRPPKHPQLSEEDVRRARKDYFELCATQSPRLGLLHADLNHFNILKDARRGWITIDPKGVEGELAFETTVLLRNPVRRPPVRDWDGMADPAQMERRVARLSRRLGLDATRILRWCAAECVLSAIWSAEGGATELHALKVGRTARQLLSA